MLNASLVNRLLVAAMVALPVVPVLRDYIGPSTYARWLLADAANRYDRGEIEAAHDSLERAYEMAPDILQDTNFWKQFERIEFDPEQPAKSIKIWADMVRQVKTPEGQATAAMAITELLSKAKRFEAAVRLLEEFLPPISRRDPIQNNQIAYMRSLALIDCETGLLEVNQALKSSPNEPSFLDTRAWLLHQLDRNEEALSDIDRVWTLQTAKLSANPLIERLITKMASIEAGLGAAEVSADASESTSEVFDASPVADDRPEDASVNEIPSERLELGLDDSDSPGMHPDRRGWAHDELMAEFPLISRSLPEITEMLATLRYHRFKIHERLGNTEEAERDARWLHAFYSKDPVELY